MRKSFLRASVCHDRQACPHSARLRDIRIRGIGCPNVRIRELVGAAIIFSAGCSEKHANHEVPADTGTLIATPSAAASTNAAPSASVLPSVTPSATRVLESPLNATDEARFGVAIRGAIERNEIPGAVLIVLQHGQVVLRRAYGNQAKEPAPSALQIDTLFDLASLTKPLATATSILLLADRGALRLQDPVQKWFPKFHPDKRITLEHLLVHTSGLPPGNGRAEHAGTRARAVAEILETPLDRAPGEAYVYSDLGYVLLGEVAGKVSGETLDVFAKKNIFEPLAMRDTMFRPPTNLHSRIAPTTWWKEEMLTGNVHDPLARALGGVAGHAGLFSTAGDLVKFVTALMSKGEVDGKAVLSPHVVRQLLEFRPLPGDKEKRSLGLAGMFEGIGHTGFTGTAFWIDAQRDHAVILLTNAVHPDGKGRAKQVRQDVASAAILMDKSKEKGASVAKALVKVGVDVLEQSGFALLDSRKIGLITNHTGKNARGDRTIDAIFRQHKLTLLALFTPEHGLGGTADELVKNGRDSATGLPIYSLYGQDKRPPDAAFANLDTLVFDIQDAGTRFYTYITTLGYMMEEAAKRKLRFVVLDRPNPLGGVAMEGPVLDRDRESFVGYHQIPVRHGMTVGELARLFNAERKLGVDLHVVPMEGWTRKMFWANTSLSWIPPSPNLRSPVEALLYPGVGLLETTNVSVGRGTEQPFERIGSPYIDSNKLADELNRARLPGVHFAPIRFTPNASTFAHEECGGVRIEVTNASVLEPVRMGLFIAITLRKLYGAEWKSAGLMTLLGNARVFEALVRGDNIDAIMKLYEKDLAAFAERRGPFLLYP